MKKSKININSKNMLYRNKGVSPILIKFVKSDFLDDIMDGNIYFNNIKYYKILESNGNDKVIGDEYEGRYPLDTKILIKNKEACYYEPLGDFLNCKTSFPFNEDGIFLSCYYSPKFQSNNKVDNNIIIPKKTIFRMSDSYNSEYKIVVMKGLDFSHDLIESCNKKAIELQLGNVIYDNHQFSEFKRLTNVFHKRTRYYYQSEYRLVIYDNRKKDPFKIKLDDNYILGTFDFIKGKDMIIHTHCENDPTIKISITSNFPMI